MSSTVEIELPPAAPTAPIDRRGDVEAKHERIARLLEDSNCDGVFLMESASFRWFTGASPWGGLFAPGEEPVLYCTSSARWLIASNADSQRIFDEELDGLGFQLKEWPWHIDRNAYLADLANGRRIACDQPFRDWLDVGGFLIRERGMLTPFAQMRYRELGSLLVHALEATARSISIGDTEDEIAGHLSHRLRRHGARPHALQVAADERANRYARPVPRNSRVRRTCTIQATAEKFGLFATAARSICFGMPDEVLRRDRDLAVRFNVVWLAVAEPMERIGKSLDRACRALQDTTAEHAWRTCPIGWRTGHSPADGLLLPDAAERFVPNSAVVLQARVGSAVLCDTYLLGDNSWETMTPPEEWPRRRAVVQGQRYERPDLLVLPG